MKIITRILIVSFGLYLTGCAAIYFYQEKLLFRPMKLDASTHFRFGEERWFEMEDGTRLHSLHDRDDDARGVILYLHGNRGHVRWCQRQAEQLAGLGYDVLMLDYRGYGLSEGEITSEEQLFSDVDEVYQELAEEYGKENIVLFGYSMGSGMATYLAEEHGTKHLFLVAPYESILDLKADRFPIVPDFLVKYPLENDVRLAEVDYPVTLFHGTEDSVIPYQCSVDLKAANPDQINFITLEGGSHRSVIFSDRMREELRRVLVE